MMIGSTSSKLKLLIFLLTSTFKIILQNLISMKVYCGKKRIICLHIFHVFIMITLIILVHNFRHTFYDERILLYSDIDIDNICVVNNNKLIPIELSNNLQHNICKTKHSIVFMSSKSTSLTKFNINYCYTC
jgi:hypothetical protein